MGNEQRAKKSQIFSSPDRRRPITEAVVVAAAAAEIYVSAVLSASALFETARPILYILELHMISY